MTDELVIVPSGKRYREELYDLGSKVFPVRGNYFDAKKWCRDCYFGNSHYDSNTSHLGILNGQVVSHFGVWDYQMRVGGAELRVGGIGLVATHGEMRKMGLMSLTATASFVAMRDAGYDMSVLFGIDDMYHRFGYTRAWVENSYLTGVNDLPLQQLRLTSIAPMHTPELARLSNKYNAGLTGTAVRPTYLRCGMEGIPTAWRWRGADGETAGYIMVQQNGQRMSLVDFAGDPVDVLAATRHCASKLCCTEVYFPSLHLMSPLARILRRGNCRVEQSMRRNGGAMARVLNLSSSLTKMAEELSARLANSIMRDWTGIFQLRGAGEQVSLLISNNQVTVTDNVDTLHALVANDNIVQFLLGTAEPGEIIAAGAETYGDAAELALALFPAQHPMLGMWDRF